jgi:rRNA maturation RNase YbeY
MMTGRENIWFFSEGTTYSARDRRLLRRWIDRMVKEEGFTAGPINIIFCSDTYLADINLKYLKHNTYTDIVTFDMTDKEGIISGDIYISVERAKENAKRFKVRYREEIRRLIAHGILHLAGYADKTPEEREQMTRKEDYYLSLPAE